MVWGMQKGMQHTPLPRETESSIEIEKKIRCLLNHWIVVL